MPPSDLTLWGSYLHTAARNADRAAVIDQSGQALTHGQLASAANTAAAALGEIGLRGQQNIGVFLPNRVAWPVVALACARLGVGALGLNTRFRHAELNHLLAVAQVDVVIAVDQFLGIDGPQLLSELDRPVRTVALSAGGWAETLTPTSPAGQQARVETAADGTSPDPDSRHPLIGFTTSGTTGFPKVAMHNQAQTLSHVEAVADSFGLSAEAVTLVPLPFCGAFGYTMGMATLLAGGSVVLHETWDPDAAAAAIDEHGVTFASASDDMLLALAASKRFNRSTTWTDGGFADFTNAGADAVAAVEQATDGTTRLCGLYGSSEGFALMSTWDRHGSLSQRIRNGGHLVSSAMSVRCCDPETGAPMAHGEPGELQFQGPNLVDGYLNNPDATLAAFTEDGWYRSGDLGHTIDPDERGHQGFVFLARLGDTLRLRGFLCDPAEIEKHLETHPLVDLAQVVGVKRPGAGDVAVGFVRLASAGTSVAVTEADLVAHCRHGLANYKRPERVVIVDEFPVTDGPNGVKIRKVELRQWATKLLEAAPDR